MRATYFFVKVPETPILPLASALTLNPSPKRGEGLQSGTPLLPFWEKGLGDEGDLFYKVSKL